MITQPSKSEPRRGAERGGRKGEQNDYFDLAESALLKVMVDRRHFEEPLSVGQLEVRHLKDDGYRLEYVNESGDYDDERIAEYERASADDRSEIKASRVSHKHSRRVEIVHEETCRGADD